MRGLQPKKSATQQTVAVEDLHRCLPFDEPNTLRNLCRRQVRMRDAGHGGSEQDNQTFEFHALSYQHRRSTACGRPV
jgi:hypothetical protein